jgi:hypothetical protein
MSHANVTEQMLASGAAALKPGQTYWRSEGGNLFMLYILHDEVASHHGNEVLRLFATQVDEVGVPKLRANGQPMQDPQGHHIHQQLGDSVDTVSDGLNLVAIPHYLSRMDGAVKNAADADALHAQGFIVRSSKAHFIPANLTHLQPRQG